MARLKEKYRTVIVPQLRETLGIKNPMLVPKVDKIVVNMGFGIVEKDVQKRLLEELAEITGQKPQIRRARKSISNFKLRDGMVVGAKVTLRGDRMYEFLDKLVSVTLPRIRDFRGLSPRGFDRQGNYSFGLDEQSVFPEIDPLKSQAEQGMDITVCTTTKDRDMARELLSQMGMPFAAKRR